MHPDPIALDFSMCSDGIRETEDSLCEQTLLRGLPCSQLTWEASECVRRSLCRSINGKGKHWCFLLAGEESFKATKIVAQMYCH